MYLSQSKVLDAELLKSACNFNFFNRYCCTAIEKKLYYSVSNFSSYLVLYKDLLRYLPDIS